jgi:hypothetical protein
MFLGIYWMMRTDLLRTVPLSILLQVRLYSETHFWTIIHVLTMIEDYQAFLIVSRILLNHLAILDLRGTQMTWTSQIVHLATLPIEAVVLSIFLLVMLKIYGYRTRSILAISKLRRNS